MTQCSCGGKEYIVTGYTLSGDVAVPIIERCKECGPIFDAILAGKLDLAVKMADEALRALKTEQNEARP